MRPRPSLSRDFVDPAYGELSEDTDVIQLLAVDSETNPAKFLEYDDHRARVGRGGVLYEASRKIFAQLSFHLSGRDGIHAIGARGHWWTVWRNRNLERQEGTRTKVGRWRVKKPSVSSVRVAYRVVTATVAAHALLPTAVGVTLFA